VIVVVYEWQTTGRIANIEVTMEQLDPLRQAAVTLLTAAPLGAVILAVRALLDGWEQGEPLAAPVTAPAPAAPPVAARAASQDATVVKARRTPPTSNGADDAAWMQLRQEVRKAREARGLTVRALADELGMTHTTLKFVLYCRQPPSKAIRKRLTDWLAAAPEVAAAPAEPFRPNGAGYAADTSDDAGRLAA
jgi:hypothetical protein